MTATPEPRSTSQTPSQAGEPPTDPLAAILSYLIPGLGQMVQGRVGKGLIFLVCLYAMFFYGLYLGNWQNVYVAQGERGDNGAPMRRGVGVFLGRVLDRARIYGQIWIGVAAWPAMYQYYAFKETEEAHPTLGRFMREPTEHEMNEVLRNSDKTPDLGWMYTVIAGVLNILVIYDAFAGPAFLHRPPGAGEPSSKETPAPAANTEATAS